MSSIIVSKTKRESELQSIIMSIFQDYGHPAINEDLSKANDDVLQEHQYLVLSPLENLTKGLRHYIQKFNKHIIEDSALLETYTQEEIVSMIEESFTLEYDKSDYLGIYRLVFQEFSDTRQVDIDGNIYSYNLISFQKPAENEVFVIKERRITKKNGGFEKPDFAIYMNGIPVFAVEVKTRKAGLDEAFKDYKNKKTYQKFIGCIGTDLDHTFIAMDPTAPSIFRWKAYGENKNPQQMTSFNFEELLCEILPSKNACSGLLFYIQNCSFILENDGNDKIINHRCQQYYTVKKLDVMLHNIQTAKEDGKRDSLIKEVVKHAQRSGKSITILSLVNLLATKYPSLFSKIYIFVPDLTILSVLKKAFGNQPIAGTGKPLQMIKRISHYSKSIETQEDGLTVYLMNIQKSRNEEKVYKNNDVLILIDEVHTHQNGLGAESRDINFPNASYISFTATPRIKSLKGDLVDVTSTTYGKTPSKDNEIEYLDEFNISDALELGIIAKLNYEKSVISEDWDRVESADFETQVGSISTEKIETDHDLKEQVFLKQEAIIREAKHKLDKGFILDKEYDRIVDSSYDEAFEYVRSSISKKAHSAVAFDITQTMFEDKVNFIIDDVKRKRENLSLKEESGMPPFKTKALWFVKSTKIAKETIRYIKSISHSEENIYQDIRFGIDFSEQALYDEDLEGQHEIQKEVDALNGTYLYGDGVLSDFESQDDHAIDVLIVVGKYLMGYDLGTLMTVYLDTEIKEPARFFQMATRPITNYPKKDVGFLVDMTMGETNYATFLQSIRYYDNNDHMETFVLSSDDIEAERDIIERNLTFISSSIFGVMDYRKMLQENPESYVDVLMNEKDPSEQMSFFRRMKNVNSSFSNLVTPEHYRDYLGIFSYLLVVGKIYYKEMFNKEDSFRLMFDPKFISEVIEEAMENLNITSFEQLARYSIIGSTDRQYKEEDKDINIDAGEFDDHLSFADKDDRDQRGVSSIYDWLSSNSHKLDESIDKQIRKRKKREAGGEIEKDIEANFDGNEMLYWAFNDFLEKLKNNGELPEFSHQTEGVFKQMMKDILGSMLKMTWETLSKNLYANDESDINHAIEDAYSRVEDPHTIITRYGKRVDNKSEATSMVKLYLSLFINHASNINPVLRESIISSIQIQKEEMSV